MACIIDSFDRANNATTLGTADSGETWTARPSLPFAKSGAPRAQTTSVMGITSGSVAYAPGPDYGPVMTIDHGWSDGTVKAQVGWPGSGGPGDYGAGVGVVFRWAGATSFFICFTNTSTSGIAGYVFLRKYTSPTTYSDPAGPWLIPGKVPGDLGELAVALNGPDITVSFDGVVLGTATDAMNETSTEHGVVDYFAVSTGIQSYGPSCPLAVGNPQVRIRRAPQSPVQIRRQPLPAAGPIIRASR
jgi:hypothetical protein